MAVRAPLRTADPAAPRITRQDVLNCQIEEWYPAFSRHSIKFKLIIIMIIMIIIMIIIIIRRRRRRRRRRGRRMIIMLIINKNE